MVEATVGRRDFESARNLALVNYGLLFAAIFFAGVPALIAVIIAYSQRDEAPTAIRSHHDFQIRIFWIAFALSTAAGICGLAAAISIGGEMLQASRTTGWDGFDTVNIDLSQVSIDGAIVWLLAGTAMLIFTSIIWLVAAPAVGFIRLASAQPIGHSPAA